VARISASGSKVSAWVIPTNEELTIARHTLKIAQAAPR
jgi:acetate kinase